MIIRIIRNTCIIIVLAVLVLIAGLLVYLSVTEYKPAATQELPVVGEAGIKPEAEAEDEAESDDILTIMSWNIGYGALGDNADFFMDGGEMVMTADQERILENMEGILSDIENVKPQILFLQEVDHNSSRSYHLDECQMIRDRLDGYESSFAFNHKTPLVPYPIPPIGKVEAGVMTFTDSHVTSASRIQLPIPFKWPVRMVNLKRCVMETRIPVDDKELVLFNLHLEAYDDGEGKVAQTRMLAQLLINEIEKGNYVIAGGDFNQFFSTEDREAYPEQADKWQPGILDTDQFGEGFTFLTDSKIPSCRSLDQPYEGVDHDTFQYYVIDGFIISDNIKVKELKTIDLDFKNSDHNPVVMRFRME